MLGLATGTRTGALLAVQWDWLDLDAGVMLRRAPGEAESATKRRPPVRLGRKILAHLRRWKRIDETIPVRGAEPSLSGPGVRALCGEPCEENKGRTGGATPPTGAISNVIHYHGQPIRTIRVSWRNAVMKSGLDDAVTPHTLRHTRATWLMRAGIDPWRAAQHLGMSVKILLSVYGQHHPDFQKEAADI